MTRSTVNVREDGPAEEEIVLAPTRARRSVLRPAPAAIELTREQEFAYIRSDLRRLLVIAGGLLAVMLVLLIVLNR